MSDESRHDDLKEIWKSQERENAAMRAQEVQIKARRYRTRVRREETIAIVLAIGLILLCAAILATGGWSNGPGPVVLSMMILVFFVFGRFVYLTFRKAGRIWPLTRRTTEPDLSESCLQFYRAGLEKQRRGYDTGPWDLFLLVPLFTVVFAPLLVRGAIRPLPVGLIGICIVLAFLARRREARRVRRELDALDAFERSEA
jgi:Flp pilus assembly protein TadB